MVHRIFPKAPFFPDLFAVGDLTMHLRTRNSPVPLIQAAIRPRGHPERGPERPARAPAPPDPATPAVAAVVVAVIAASRAIG